MVDTSGAKPASAAAAGPSMLSLRVRDVMNLHAVMRSSGLSLIPPEQIHVVVMAGADEGVLTKGAFDACIRRLIPGSRLTSQQKQFLSTPEVALRFFHFVFRSCSTRQTALTIGSSTQHIHSTDRMAGTTISAVPSFSDS